MNDEKLKSYLQDRLGDYSHPVDNTVWDRVVRDISPVKRKRGLPLLISGLTIGAAAVIALMVILFAPGEDNAGVNNSLISENTELPSGEPSLLQTTANVRKVDLIQKRAAATDTVSPPHIAVHVPDDEPEAGIEETIAAKQDNISEKRSTTTNRNGKVYAVGQSKQNGFLSERSTLKNKKISFIASANGISGIGGDNGLSNSSPPTDMDPGDFLSGSGDGITNPAERLLDPVYHFPVNFTLSIRKNLSQRFGVESGLSYTYLRTSDNQSDRAVKLHYLGVPVKVVYTFNPGRRVTYYGSAGGTVEMQVSGKLYTKHTEKKLTNSHPQFSIGSAVGMQVNLGKRIALFAEPGVVYYFDDGCNIPTIRKDKPLNFNLQLGIRVDLE